MQMTAPVLDALAALADPVRGRLLVALERHELAVGELATVLQLPQSTVSRHLKTLVEAGWAASRPAGPSRRARPPGAGRPPPGGPRGGRGGGGARRRAEPALPLRPRLGRRRGHALEGGA